MKRGPVLRTVEYPAHEEGRVVTEPREVDPQLARQLVLDELFDLSLYESVGITFAIGVISKRVWGVSV